MKRYLIVAFLLFMTSSVLFAGDVMTKNTDGTYIINTSHLCVAKGYRGTTPLEVYIKNGVVVKVVTLKNNETVPYFERIKKFLLPLYEGRKLSKAKKLSSETKIDGCTGATYSTKAVQKNIRAAIEYYEKNK
ncbi:MAG: FMN-binding protein [Prevotella sp.]